MRLLLILGLIASGGWWGYQKLTDENSSIGRLFSKKDQQLAANGSVTGLPGQSTLDPLSPPAAVAPPRLASSSTASSSSSLSSADPRALLPVSSVTVRLRNRELPDQQWLTSWATMGVTLVPDPVARAVTVAGPLDRVEMVSKALRDLDDVQGSCALQAWCVYVDSSIEKGWDLVAAIGAVTGGGFRAVVSPGSVTLDLGNDSIAAALAMIADGVSVEVVQNPYVRLTHLKPAIIEAISEFPVPQTTVSNGLAQTSIEFRKVGLQFSVSPRFLGGNRVALDVTQKNGVVGNPVEIGGNEIPVVDTQTVSSTVELDIGQGIVLGGVKTSRLRHSKGLLRDKVEASNGVFYVVLSTTSEIPKARPVGSAPVLDPTHGLGASMVLPLRAEPVPWDSPDGKPTLGLPLPEK
jgi:hypothetical protein